MDEARLDEITGRFEALKILVLGDFFLDRYLIIHRALRETSLETGLECHQVVAVQPSPGAAGTVVNNLRAMGVSVRILGVIGDTGEGYELRRAFAASGVDQSLLIVRPDLLTPTYTKPMMHEPDGRVHELERIDIKNRAPLPTDVEGMIIERLRAAVPQVDAVIISEYVQERNHGAVTDRVREEVIALAQRYPQKVFAADSRTRIDLFRQVVIKSNLREAWRALGRDERGEPPLSEVLAASQEIARRNGRPVFITLGERGMAVSDGQRASHVPTVRETGPIDPVGAGDAAIAGIASALAAGASPEEAALIGNLAAAVTIRKIGTTGTASVPEIKERLACLKEQNRTAD